MPDGYHPTYNTTTIDLHPDLYWSDGLDWAPVEQSVQRSVSGALIVMASERIAGRPDHPATRGRRLCVDATRDARDACKLGRSARTADDPYHQRDFLRRDLPSPGRSRD